MATAHVYEATPPPPASPPTWSPSPAAHVSAHCQKGGGRQGASRRSSCRTQQHAICLPKWLRGEGGGGTGGGAAGRLALSARWAHPPRQSEPPLCWLRLAAPEHVAGGERGGEGLGASPDPTRWPVCGWHLSSAAAPCRPGHFGGGGGTDTAGSWWTRLGPAWGRVRDEVRPLRPRAAVAQSLLIPPYPRAIATTPPALDGSITTPPIRLPSPRHLPLPVHRLHLCGAMGGGEGGQRESRDCLAGGGCYGAEPRPPDPRRETAVAMIRRGAPPAACATGASPRRETGLTKTRFAPVRAR